jgi:hypothetical protein
MQGAYRFFSAYDVSGKGVFFISVHLTWQGAEDEAERLLAVIL